MTIKNNLIQPTAETDGTWLQSQKQRASTQTQKPKQSKANKGRLDYNVDASTWK